MLLKKILLTAIAGGFILMAWNSISWMVLPFHMRTLHGFSNEAVLVDAVKAGASQTGVYYFPFRTEEAMKDKAAETKWQQAYNAGPTGLAMVEVGGSELAMGASMLRGFIFYIFLSGIAAFLLVRARGTLNTYRKRVVFVTLLGVFATLAGDWSNWNWWHFPTDYTVAMSIDTLVGWLLVGIVAAAIVRPRQAEPSPV